MKRIINSLLILLVLTGTSLAGGLEFSGIQTMLSRLSDSRAVLLDKLNISGNVCDGSYFTSTRAGFLDKLNISGNVASSGEVCKASVYTSTLASGLATLKKAPQIKAEAGGLVVVNTPTASDNIFSAPSAGVPLTVDKLFGVRVVQGAATTSLQDFVNVTGSGWILGVFQRSDTTGLSQQLTITIDGTLIYDSTYSLLPNGNGRLPIGIYWSSTPFYAAVTPWPVRFNSSFNVQVRSSSASNNTTTVVYLLD